MSRVIERTDARGRQYADVLRAVGLMASDPVRIHAGLPGFLAPEWIGGTVYVVERPQTFSRKRQEQRDAERR